QETHISQHGGSSTDKGTDVDAQDEGDKNDESDDGNEDDDDETVKDDDEDDGNGDEDQGLRINEEEMIQEEEEADKLYRDVNINQGRGLQVSQDIKDSHDAGVESIFTTASSPIVSLHTPTPIMTPSTIATITTSRDAPIPPTPFPDDVLQNLPTFDSVFRFDERLKSLETTFSEYRQTNPFVDAVSAISVAADLTEIELKKILIEKMEGNKSIQRSDEQPNLYKALVDAYEADKNILESYGESAILKRRCEDDDDQEGPSAGSDRGSKRQREGREHASADTPSEPATRNEGRTGAEDQPMIQPSQHPEWFSQPRKPPTPDRDWNKTLPAIQGSAQPWISELAKQADARSSFNDLLDTPIDFSNFIMNRLGVDTLTSEFLAGPTYELMRGSCNSLTELEYHLEEVYKATADHLDSVNPEGQQYQHNLLQPLPLIPDSRGRCVIPFEHFINNDLEYLRGGASSRKYTTSVTKTKAADFGHIKWIEDLVPRAMWIHEPLQEKDHRCHRTQDCGMAQL
nr:hypothetical protein [Tanacetum cinerariifolium]